MREQEGRKAGDLNVDVQKSGCRGGDPLMMRIKALFPEIVEPRIDRWLT
jgi:hypothetical protein